MTLGEKKKIFTPTLFRWHKDNYRDMPWRDTRDPYAILVSELMLQQTQVERVRIKYVEFLKLFPTLTVLADASLGDVLRAWSGLGYNRRAKYLHECAREVIEAHGGKFPKDEMELKKLPGIGPSTAAALASFAFDSDTPMIDTNIRRILMRVFFTSSKLSRSDLDKKPSDKELYQFAKMLIPEGKGRMWNYAMLDVGATQCTARNHSGACPLMKLHGRVGDFVYKKPQLTFLDSRRFYRGKILQLLVNRKRVSVATLPRLLGKEIPDVGGIIGDLKKDGLIVGSRGIIALPK